MWFYPLLVGLTVLAAAGAVFFGGAFTVIAAVVIISGILVGVILAIGAILGPPADAEDKSEPEFLADERRKLQR